MFAAFKNILLVAPVLALVLLLVWYTQREQKHEMDIEETSLAISQLYDDLDFAQSPEKRQFIITEIKRLKQKMATAQAAATTAQQDTGKAEKAARKAEQDFDTEMDGGRPAFADFVGKHKD